MIRKGCKKVVLLVCNLYMISCWFLRLVKVCQPDFFHFNCSASHNVSTRASWQRQVLCVACCWFLRWRAKGGDILCSFCLSGEWVFLPFIANIVVFHILIPVFKLQDWSSYGVTTNQLTLIGECIVIWNLFVWFRIIDTNVSGTTSYGDCISYLLVKIAYHNSY